ncbi:hypothetical protein OSB04_016289 [Centaurea solstitialis]|uniref:BRCT domain-containing protein n=1 Tax=Centaurea solstitialis TaxID=347529 RepID=A0AA38WJJ9_9ASTR|nr:hypothetical protein OSB04_016289 [Centaurea solstitialis]
MISCLHNPIGSQNHRTHKDDFLFLCPKHASHKFPREQKSKAGKHDTIESVLRLSLQAVVGQWCPNTGDLNVTHVVAAVDSKGACTRTLKVLMAILNGKWIVTVEWVKACVKAGRVVDEEPYEVQLDTHGCSGGPKAGRLRILNNNMTWAEMRNGSTSVNL